MPHKIKFNAPTAGEHEIELPAEFLHLDEVKTQYSPKDQFQSELERRVKSITEGLRKPEELITDEPFFKTFVEKRKDDLMKALNIPAPKDGPDIPKIRGELTEQITREQITPLQESIKAATTEIDSLRERDLAAQVFSSAAGLRVVPTLVDLVQLYVRGKAGWDKEQKQWFIKKEDGSEGFEFSSDPKKGGHTFLGIKEYMEKLSVSPDKKSWFEVGSQPGAGFNAGSGNPKTMTVDQFQKLSAADKTKLYSDSPDDFTRLMDEIRQAGETKLFGGKK